MASSVGAEESFFGTVSRHSAKGGHKCRVSIPCEAVTSGRMDVLTNRSEEKENFRFILTISSTTFDIITAVEKAQKSVLLCSV